MNLMTQFINQWKLSMHFNPKQYWTKRGTDYFGQYPPTGERGESILLKTLGELEFTSLLDIGCGYGRYLKAITEKFPEVKLLGADISSTQIDEAKKFLSVYPRIQLYETDGIKLPFDNKTIDISFTYGCIMHVPPPSLKSFFSEICRVTKSKGLFFESSLIKRPVKRYFSPSVIWYPHNYDALFTSCNLAYKVLAETKEKNIINRLYLVDFDRNVIP